jgi:exodeoxyribonuclease VII large subunit
LGRALDAGIEQRALSLQVTMAGLRKSLLEVRLTQLKEHLKGLVRRQERDIQLQQRDAEIQLAHLGKLLRSYSYEGVLERGYAVVRRAGQVTTRAAGLEPGQAIELQFRDGRRSAEISKAVGSISAQPALTPTRKDKKKIHLASDDPQGTLL